MARIDREYLRNALKVYFIFGSNNCLKNPAEVLEEAIDGGVTIFQFREKGKDAFKGTEKVMFAKKLQTICRANKIPFIVNDDIELALQLNADGVHIGQEDEPVSEVRKKIGDKILGVSAHSLAEVQLAIENGADYLGLGPIYPTDTKEDAKAVQGTSLLEMVRDTGIDIPIVGIGGINADNADEVVKAGADGVAVITAISHSSNPADAAGKLKNIIFSI